MGGAGLPGRHEQVPAAEDEAGGLGAAHGLAAAVGHHRGAALQVHAGDGQVLGGGVGQDGDLPRPGDLGDHLQRQGLPGIGGRAGDDVDHGRVRVDGALHLLGGVDHHQLDADHAQGVVVGRARGAGQDHLGLVEAVEVGHPDQPLRTAAGDAGRGHVLEAGGAARRDQPPLGAGDRRQVPAHRLGQLVELREVAVGGVHGGHHLRQLHRAAEDGEGAAAVDDRLHADRLVDVAVVRVSVEERQDRQPFVSVAQGELLSEGSLAGVDYPSGFPALPPRPAGPGEAGLERAGSRCTAGSWRGPRPGLRSGRSRSNCVCFQHGRVVNLVAVVRRLGRRPLRLAATRRPHGPVGGPLDCLRAALGAESERLARLEGAVLRPLACPPAGSSRGLASELTPGRQPTTLVSSLLPPVFSLAGIDPRNSSTHIPAAAP